MWMAMVATVCRRMALPLIALLTLLPLSALRAETLDELYEKAKAEKSLVFYTGAGVAAAKATAEAFEKRFPGISVTGKGGFSNVLDSEIDQQLKDKKVTTDFVQFQTIQDYRRWDKAGALMHFKPDGFDQVLAPMKDKNGAWVAVYAIPMSYGYNSEKVQEADVPKSALDFLKPQFRGKVVTVYPTDDDATLYNFRLNRGKVRLGLYEEIYGERSLFHSGASRRRGPSAIGRTFSQLRCHPGRRQPEGRHVASGQDASLLHRRRHSKECAASKCRKAAADLDVEQGASQPRRLFPTRGHAASGGNAYADGCSLRDRLRRFPRRRKATAGATQTLRSFRRAGGQQSYAIGAPRGVPVGIRWKLTPRCLVLAQSGHPDTLNRRLLLGVKRTLRPSCLPRMRRGALRRTLLSWDWRNEMASAKHQLW